MPATACKSTALFFREGSSDKEYNVFIEECQDGYMVRVTYGRRGNASTTQNKTQMPVSYATAEKVFDKCVKEKTSKGYAPMDGASVPTPFSAPDTVDRITGLVPQLLNPIEETDIDSYVRHSNYLAQEKLDGKRIMARVDFSAVTASNRNGLSVGIPKDIEQELSGFEDCVVDGELVGSVYYVFDVLEYQGQSVREQTCKERFDLLCDVLIGDKMLECVALVPTGFSMSEKASLVESLRHKEGVVFKRLDAPYVPGRPAAGGSQLKCKFWSSATCVVHSHSPAKRSIHVAVVHEDTGGEMLVGKVTVPPNYEMPPVGSFVEVKYLYYYPGGSLFQPQYLGIRDDKTEADNESTLKPKATDED